MSSDESRPSVWLTEKSSTSTLVYIPVEEYMTIMEEEVPQKEKFVRLMSFDVDEEGQSSTSTEYQEFKDVCPQYWDVVSFAENFVSDIISEAEGLINKHIQMPIRAASAAERVFAPRYSSEYPVIEYNRPKFTEWPTIREYTVELGAEKIDEYLASFNTNEEWLYIIYYVGLKSDYNSKYYEYQAIWSLPSPEYPIAQATASVFFTIEVSEVLPIDCFVNITFSFEGHQFKHKPGIIDFNEEWLNFILDSKIGVFKQIKF